jgi:hypothetical protein
MQWFITIFYILFFINLLLANELPEVHYKSQPPLIIKEAKATIVRFEKSIELKEKNITPKGKINYKDCTPGFR